MADKALGLLGLMRRAGAIEIGVDNAADALRAGRAKLLLLSCDAADNARRKIENLSVGRRALTVPLDYTREVLGDSLGVGGCSAAAVTDIGFASALMKELAAQDPERYAEAAQEIAKRCEKTARRKKETVARKGLKRNDKRRTEEWA
jgi:ribosomal protein L7Ae-like RNA K-turn-binding protein